MRVSKGAPRARGGRWWKEAGGGLTYFFVYPPVLAYIMLIMLVYGPQYR